MTLLLALVLLAMPLTGHASLSPKELARELLDMDRSVTLEITTHVEGEPEVEGLLENPERAEQLRHSIRLSGLFANLSTLRLTANTRMNAFRAEMLINGQSAVAADLQWTEEGLAVQSGWLLNRPILMGQEGVQQTAPAAMGEEMLKLMGADFTKLTEAMPNVFRWLSALRQRLEQCEEPQPEDSDPAAQAWRITLTHEDLMAAADALWADLQLRPQVAQTLKMDEAAFKESWEKHVGALIPEETTLVCWTDAENRLTAVQGDHLSARRQGADWRADLQSERITAHRETLWECTDTHLQGRGSARIEERTGGGTLVIEQSQTTDLDWVDGALSGVIVDDTTACGVRTHTEVHVTTGDPLPEMDMSKAARLAAMDDRERSRIQGSMIGNLLMGTMRMMQLLPEELVNEMTQMIMTMQQRFLPGSI